MVASLPAGTRGGVGLPRAGSHTWVKCVPLPALLTAVEKLSKVPGGARSSAFICVWLWGNKGNYTPNSKAGPGLTISQQTSPLLAREVAQMLDYAPVWVLTQLEASNHLEDPFVSHLSPTHITSSRKTGGPGGHTRHPTGDYWTKGWTSSNVMLVILKIL